MRHIPGAYLAPSPEIMPSDDQPTWDSAISTPSSSPLEPQIEVVNHVASSTTSPIPRLMHTYTIEHKIHANIQKLRCVPFESSPLTWPAITWEWHAAGKDLERDEYTVPSAECPGAGEDVDMASPSEAPQSSKAVAYPKPQGFISSGESMISDDINTFVELPLLDHAPRQSPLTELSPKARSLKLRVKSPSSCMSSFSPPSISSSPGSARTKITIRRRLFVPTSPQSEPDSPSPVPLLIHADSDTDMEEGESLGARRNKLPTPLSIAIKLRDRSHKAARRTRGSLTVGGRMKVYDENNARLCALLRAWEVGLMTRWDPVEAYRIMERPFPMLGSPPPGFGSTGEPPDMYEGKGGKPKMASLPRSTSKAYKRLRYSPEAAKRFELEGEMVGTSGSPEQGRRKKGKKSLLELDSVSMTRMPSPEFALIDLGVAATGESNIIGEGNYEVDLLRKNIDDGAGPSVASAMDIDEETNPEPPSIGPATSHDASMARYDPPVDEGVQHSALSIVVPEFTLSVEPPSPLPSAQYTINPRTGRRSLITPINVTQPPTQLESRFSPPSPGESDGWELYHFENASPEPPAQPPSILGLNLGDAILGEINPYSASSGTSTPTLSVEMTPDDAELVKESQRLRLCAAIEVLAAQHYPRLSEADWTPPLRGSGIDDTPNSVADELITTPEMDIADLPMSLASSPITADEEDEEMPRLRLDKGKGRARPEDIQPDPRAQSLYVETGPRPEATYKTSTDRTRGLDNEEWQALLEGLVMELSKLEAEHQELTRDAGGSDGTEVRWLAKRIRHLNREVRKYSAVFGVLHHAGSTSSNPHMDSDEDIALRLQLEYERENAIYAEEQRRLASISRPQGLSGIQVDPSQTHPVRSSADSLDTDGNAPKLARQTARHLTFGSPDVGDMSQPQIRRPVSSLLDRSSIFETSPSATTARSAMLDGIRMRNKAAHTTRSIDQPIIPPQLYPLPRPLLSDKVHIVITPPTPIVHLRQPAIVEEHPTFLADPLDMGGSCHGESRDQMGVVVDVQEVDMDVVEEDMSDGGGSDKTIRPDSVLAGDNWVDQTKWESAIPALPMPVRRLSEPFDTPTVPKRAYQVRRLSMGDVHAEDSTSAGRSGFDLSRSARILFDNSDEEVMRGAHDDQSENKVRKDAELWSIDFDDAVRTFKSTQNEPLVHSPILPALDSTFLTSFRFLASDPYSGYSSPGSDLDAPGHSADLPLTHSTFDIPYLDPWFSITRSPSSPRSPRSHTPSSRNISLSSSVPDFDSSLYIQLEPWLPGELAERLGWEVARIALQNRMLRRRRMRRALVMVARIVLAVLAWWICCGFLGIVLNLAGSETVI